MREKIWTKKERRWIFNRFKKVFARLLWEFEAERTSRNRGNRGILSALELTARSYWLTGRRDILP